jgi:predicted dithiol-disulfide oxidoreductase (DUF899 family)
MRKEHDMSNTITRFPNESIEYREARDRLLQAEVNLRDAIERVAAQRRQLPPGPLVTQDYVFQEGPRDLDRGDPVREVRFSSLFEGGHDDLIVIHYMFSPNDEAPCPMCTMWADGYNAVAPHIEQQAGIVLVAAAPIDKLRAIARQRGWHNLRLLSALENTFNLDWQAEDNERNQKPAVSVFHRDPDGSVRLFSFTEMMLERGPAVDTSPPPGQDERGIDLYSPVWNLLDLLPGGRGGWYPSLPDQPLWFAEATASA